MNLNWFALTLGVTPITAENLIVESASLNAGFFTFTAPHSGSGLLYQVQVSNDLTPDNWTDTGATVTGTGGPLDFQVAVTPAQTERFFRLKITSP